MGATGLREDHAIGNISLLIKYNRNIQAKMLSDHDEFSILKSGVKMASYSGEQISFFAVDNSVKVSSHRLRYPLNNMLLHNWWRASLNEVEADSFSLEFDSDLGLILY